MLTNQFLVLFLLGVSLLLPFQINAVAAETGDQAERAQHAANVIRQLPTQGIILGLAPKMR
jgi:hypothetical protein